jgi:hypothetical protein
VLDIEERAHVSAPIDIRGSLDLAEFAERDEGVDTVE